MSTEAQVEKPQISTQDAQMEDAPAPPTGPAAMSTGNKKRPRLDLNTDTRERKRGKSMFGVLLGTLNKAKIEDKERSASEAAKKRQLIEQRLQDKLRKETDTVRRAEEAKKDKTSANRKEEDLQLKDSIYKLRRTRHPLLSNFLSTADHIPSDDSSPPSKSSNPLAPLPRSHPPPLYYLPAKLTPAQDAFLKKRKAEVKEAAEQEWEAFRAERAAGVEEISRLRKRVEEENDRKKGDRRDPKEGGDDEQDVKMDDGKKEPISNSDGVEAKGSAEKKDAGPVQENGAEMDVDDESAAPTRNEEPKVVSLPDEGQKPQSMVQAAAGDEDDAVEY